MSSKYNQLYNNPAFSRIATNLTNALVGSASDDASIARANYFKSQTEGQNLKNKNVNDLRASIPKATSVLANNILRANTGNSNAQFNQSGVPIVDAGNMSMPVSGNINVLPPASMTQDNYKGTARAMLGDLTYKPDQFAAAIQNLGNAEKTKLAQRLISAGNDDQIRRGFNLLGKSPSKYFDKDVAQTEINNDFTIGMDENLKNLQSKNYKTDIYSAVDEKVGMNKNKLEAEVKEKLGLDKNKKVAEVAKYKFDNREIKIAVSKDQKVYIDKATADTLGVKPTTENGEEVYVINGKPSKEKVDQVKVKVGKADVYLSKEMADKLGIPKNDDGQYIIKGSGYNDSASKSGDTKPIKGNLIKVFDDEFKKYKDYEKFPGKIKTKFQKILQGLVEDKITQDNISFQQAFIKIAAPIIGMGTTDITVGSNFDMPTYFYKNLKMQMLNQNYPRPQSEV